VNGEQGGVSGYAPAIDLLHYFRREYEQVALRLSHGAGFADYYGLSVGNLETRTDSNVLKSNVRPLANWQPDARS